MKMNYFNTTTLFVAAAALILSFGSCSKDTDEGEGGSGSTSKTGLLTSGGWVIESGTADFGGGTFNILDFMDACDKDDIVFFKTDKTVLDDAGALKCDPSEPQTTDGGAWAFANNETQIIATDTDGEVTVMNITTLTSSSFGIEMSEYDSTISANIEIKMVYKHN